MKRYMIGVFMTLTCSAIGAQQLTLKKLDTLSAHTIQRIAIGAGLGAMPGIVSFCYYLSKPKTTHHSEFMEMISLIAGYVGGVTAGYIVHRISFEAYYNQAVAVLDDWNMLLDVPSIEQLCNKVAAATSDADKHAIQSQAYMQYKILQKEYDGCIKLYTNILHRLDKGTLSVTYYEKGRAMLQELFKVKSRFKQALVILEKIYQQKEPIHASDLQELMTLISHNI